MSEPTVYAWNPDPLPDAAFASGELHYLVAGNRGRMLDARRTPVTVVDVAAARGAFVVRIDAFEDTGTTWELWLGEIQRFQFTRDAERVTATQLGALQRSVERFDQDLVIDCDADVRRATLRQLWRRRQSVRGWLRRRAAGLSCDLEACIQRRDGDNRVYELLEAFLAEHQLEELDRVFSSSFVTNPHAGETVKGHAIVLAELGLCPYSGKIPRDPALFAGQWSRLRRSEHLQWRLAFIQELLTHLGAANLMLYRGFATDEARLPRNPGSFVSATFSRQVAEAHFLGGPTSTTAALWRTAVPLRRLLMTFLETRALNDRFHEAEAVLLGDPAATGF
jgi:hypothetical protein